MNFFVAEPKLCFAAAPNDVRHAKQFAYPIADVPPEIISTLRTCLGLAAAKKHQNESSRHYHG